MTRILVTGGAGYVGSVSVAALIAAGHTVMVLDDLSTGHAAALPEGARLYRGSYGDEASVRSLLVTGRIEAILHCAARSLVGDSIRNPATYYRDNVAGGIALLEAARQTGVQRFVFSSTAAVYGTPDESPITEDALLRPINPYGETKRTLETALEWYGRAHGLRSVTLRYFNVAGATEKLGEDHDPETHLIPNVLAATEGGPGLTVFGDDYPTPDGTCVRDYIHVADLADAHLLALEATAPGDRRTDTAARLQPRQRRRLQHPRGARCDGPAGRPRGPAYRRAAAAGRPARPRRQRRTGPRRPPLATEATVARRDHRLGARLAPDAPARLPRLTREDAGSYGPPTRGSIGAEAGASRSGSVGAGSGASSPLPVQRSLTGRSSHAPITIVASRLSTATW